MSSPMGSKHHRFSHGGYVDVRLKHAVAVARSGSFTAAAKSIGVTQSAVTRAVADLERQIGYDLFYRAARGALLTDRGRTFVARAARLLDDEQELLRGDEGIDPFAGVLRVGVCPAIIEWIVTAPLATLKAKHPAIRFEVVAGPFERMAPMLRNGGVDLVIGFDDAFKEWSDVTRYPLWEFKTALFVRKGHPLLSVPLTRSEVARYEMISPSESRPYGALIRALYESEGVDWHKRVHIADHFPTVARLVQNSDAIGMVATSYIASKAFSSTFEVIENFDLWGATPICCASRARWEQGPMAREFLKAVKKIADPLHRPLIG